MLIGGGGGWGAVTGNTYQIKTMAVPSASASGMTASEIEKLFSYLDPSAVAEAGKAHTAAAKTLQSIADSLVTHAQALADGWNGTTAQASITALQQLHQTAVQLSHASAQTGQVLTWLGETILPYYKNWTAPGNGVMGTIESFFGSNPQDHAAQQVMQRLNDRLSQANAALPGSVSINLPKIGKAGHAPATTGGSGSGRGAGAAAGGVGLTSAARGAVSPATGGSGGVVGVKPGGAGVSGAGFGGGRGVVPTGSGGHVSPPIHLVNVNPPGGTPPSVGGVPGGPGGVPGGGLSGGTSPGGGVAGGPGPIGLGPGPGTGQGAGGAPGLGGEPPGGVGVLPGEPGGTGEPGGGVGGGASGSAGAVGEDVGSLPGESAIVGSDGMIGTGPGMAEGEVGSGNTGATGFLGADDAATQSGGGFPMSGGSGGGGRESERYRQAWMAEDLDTWEGPAAPAPSLIGE